MTVLASEIRRGAYHDSIVLMRLQAALAELPGVDDAGVVMGTEANLALLADGGLLADDLGPVAADDLVAVVRAESEEAACQALGRVSELLARRRGEQAAGDFRPKSLAAAVKALPEARWVLVSVPGRWAASVAGEALDLGRHVFLYSDNVPVADEVALKRKAAERGLLVMGPDCGTAHVAGLGLGFANRVRRGAVGLVGASGTGLQAVMSRVHALGGGVSHALGTGGRDLSAEVAAATALPALDLLTRDPETRVVVLISKPPAPEVAARVLAAARAAGKPVVVCFLGRAFPARRLGNLHFARSLTEAADLAFDLASSPSEPSAAATTEGAAGLERRRRRGAHGPAAMEATAGPPATSGPQAPQAGIPKGRAPEPPEGEGGQSPARAATSYLRGLFSGGTLAQEAVNLLAGVLHPLHSNLAGPGVVPLPDPAASRGHTVVDLGADELTVGRPHPMIDPSLAAARLAREAADPEVGAVLFDLVLGDGAHADPAAALAAQARRARQDRGDLALAAVVVGTEDDPQDLTAQQAALEEAGVRVFRDLAEAVEHTLARLPAQAEVPGGEPVPLDVLSAPPAAVNVGVEVFYDSLRAQGAEAVQVDWRPPAGGDDKLAAILAKMKGG